MRIKSVSIHDYRAFQQPFKLNLATNITAISGLNGIGKSTILAILTNAAELKPKDGKLISGDKFRGDFSDVIMYDGEKDTIGPKATIEFDGLVENGNPISSVTYRATVQEQKLINFVFKKAEDGRYDKVATNRKKVRYRLIPKIEKDGWSSSSKVQWPTYYMGLSRIYPLGEADSAKVKKFDDRSAKAIIGQHIKILHEKLDQDKASFEEMTIGELFKQKAGINTAEYGPRSNSSGQDNIGQILQVVASFERLKETLGVEYRGGLLAIDEIEATLHPAAQNELYDFLLTKSKQLDLQIVFTTHSTTLLEHISKSSMKKANSNNRVKISFLHTSSDKPGLVREKENPSTDFFRHSLTETYRLSSKFSTPLYALLEDEVARWFFKLVISSSDFDSLKAIKVLDDVDISWNHIVQLRAADADNLHNMLVILDPDMNVEPLSSDLTKMIQKKVLPDTPNDPKGSLFILPGDNSVERMLCEYIRSTQSTDKLYDLSIIADNGINWDNLHSSLPDPEIAQTNDYKKWFNEFKLYMPTIAESWIVNNKDSVEKFCRLLNQAAQRLFSTLEKE